MNLQGKRVLVTGAEGFIGSHLVEHLLCARAQVRALVQYNLFNFWGWLEDVPSLDQIEVVTGDIRDSHFCSGLLEARGRLASRSLADRLDSRGRRSDGGPSSESLRLG